jgi:hypothetical protein
MFSHIPYCQLEAQGRKVSIALSPISFAPVATFEHRSANYGMADESS